MKPYILKRGDEAFALTDKEMQDIHYHYNVQCVAEYVEENYNYTFNKCERIAQEVTMLIAKYDITEDEAVKMGIERLIARGDI